MSNQILSFKDAELKYGTLLSATKAAPYFSIYARELTIMIEKYDRFSHLYLKVGKDLYARDGIGGSYKSKYYFPEKWLKENELPRLMNLKEIARELNLAPYKLSYLLRKGILDEGRYSRHKFDYNWILNSGVLEKIDREHSTFMTGFRGNVTDFLKENGAEGLVDLVKDYIQARIDGDGILVNGEYKYRKKMSKPDKNAKIYENRICIALYKIICNRSGIKRYWEKGSNQSFRELTIEELKNFNPGKFLIWDISEEDAISIKLGYTDAHFKESVEKHFIPFLYFVKNRLKEKRRKMHIHKNIGSPLFDSEEYENLMERIDIFEEGIQSFKQKIPFNPDYENSRDVYRFKREEIPLILENLHSSSIQDKLKKECILLFSIFTGIRPEELSLLRISDIELNDRGLPQGYILNRNSSKDTNYSIKTFDDNAYGLYHLPAPLSKGGYGPSPIWGNYIAPVLMRRLTDYLRYIYKCYPKIKSDKKALLFPAKYSNFYKGYHDIGRWISEYRDQLFEFVPEEERKNITYYSGRHTVAKWIVYETKLSTDLERFRINAGQVHLRHEMAVTNKKSKKIRDLPIIMAVYANIKVGTIEYLRIMNEALNFPINLSGKVENSPYQNLYDWKLKKGLLENENNEVQTAQEITNDNPFDGKKLTPEEVNEIKELEALIAQKKVILSEIRLGFSKSLQKKLNITREEWLSGKPELLYTQEIEELSYRIDTIKHQFIR